MGYSRSLVTLEKMLPMVNLLVGGKQVTFTADNPVKLAIKLREALLIAKDHPDRFPELARLRYRFEPRRAEGKVLAVPRLEEAVGVAGEGEAVGAGRAAFGVGGRQTLGGKQTVASIVSFMLENPGVTLHVPEAGLAPEELESLYNWASKRDLVFFESAGQLTIQHRDADPEAADFAWSPEDIL